MRRTIDEHLYEERHLIENQIGKLKRFRRGNLVGLVAGVAVGVLPEGEGVPCGRRSGQAAGVFGDPEKAVLERRVRFVSKRFADEGLTGIESGMTSDFPVDRRDELFGFGFG